MQFLPVFWGLGLLLVIGLSGWFYFFPPTPSEGVASDERRGAAEAKPATETSDGLGATGSTPSVSNPSAQSPPVSGSPPEPNLQRRIEEPSLPVAPKVVANPHAAPPPDLKVPVGDPNTGRFSPSAYGASGPSGVVGGGVVLHGVSDTVDGLTQVPRLIHSVKPEYTEDARRSGIRGSVVVSATVQPDGSVSNVQVLRSLGHGLDEKAVETVLRCRFAPAVANGRPIATTVKLSVLFSETDRTPPAVPSVQTSSSRDARTTPPSAGQNPPSETYRWVDYRAKKPEEVITQRPKLVHSVKPGYTEEARANRIQGTVVLSATVEPDGLLSNIQVIKSLGHGLDEKAIEAAKRCRFQPAMADGRPVRATVKFSMEFRLF